MALKSLCALALVAVAGATKLTAAEKAAVLARHNLLRSNAATKAVKDEESFLPCTASDMEMMAWDDTLASEAQAYADGCVGDHPADAGSKFGENLWMSFPDTNYATPDLEGGVSSWYNEIVDTVWGISDTKVKSKPLDQCKDKSGDHCNVGHYFQMIWAKSNKVGCGISKCESSFMISGSDYKTGVLMVCRYQSPASLGAGETSSLPFIFGQPCASCAGSCSTDPPGLCTAAPTRCLDKLGPSSALTIDKKYTSCPDLVATYGANSQMPWCTMLAAQMKEEDLCALSCGKCSVPDKVGSSFCGASGAAASTSGTTSGSTSASSTSGGSTDGTGAATGATSASTSGSGTSTGTSTGGTAAASSTTAATGGTSTTTSTSSSASTGGTTSSSSTSTSTSGATTTGTTKKASSGVASSARIATGMAFAVIVSLFASTGTQA